MSQAPVLLANDRYLFRQGFANLIGTGPDLVMIDQAGEGLEAPTLAHDLGPDLIELDINEPQWIGLEETPIVPAASDGPQARLVVLTWHDEDEQQFKAIIAGANGYVLRSTTLGRCASIGIVQIEAKSNVGEDKVLQHGGKRIFIPDGKSITLGRTSIDFGRTTGSDRGVFGFCSLPKKELIGRKDIRLGSSSKIDLHPYWFALSMKEATVLRIRVEKLGKRHRVGIDTHSNTVTNGRNRQVPQLLTAKMASGLGSEDRHRPKAEYPTQ